MLDDILNAVHHSWQHAATAARTASARVPGSPMVQTLVVGVLAGLLTYWLMKKRYRLPPGPWSLPLLGHLLWLNSKEEQFYVTLRRLAKEKYGPVVAIYLGPKLCVTLNDLDTVTEALVKRGNDYAGRPQLYSLDVITEGFKSIIFTDYCPAWKLHRKIATKALRHYMTGSHLNEVMHEVVTRVAERMAAEPGPFDPHPYNSTLMFHVISGICFGEIKPYDDPGVQRIVGLFDAANEEMGNGVLEDIVPLLKYWPTKKFQRVVSMVFEFLDYIEENIKDHRQNFSTSKVEDVTDSILLAQSEAAQEESAEIMAMFTDVHVRQTISDLFGAGVDTSRITLDWAVLFLVGHPEVQKRAQAEIDGTTGMVMPGVEHQGQLQYTQAVLLETLRLGCVAPIGLLHKALRDTTVGQYDVPKDTMVMVNLWAVTRDPALWDQPDKFIPERFLDDEGNLKPTPKAWMPFSAGPRACLGKNLAQLELLLLLACFLKHFTFSLPDGVTYDPSYKVGMMGIHIPKPFKIVATSR